MKITFVFPTAGRAGGDRVNAIYAAHLQQRGHEVFVVSQPYRQPSLREQIGWLLKGQGWISGKRSELSYIEEANVAHLVLDRQRPVTDADVPDADVIVATWWETAESVAKLSKEKGAKAYFIQHHEVFDYLPRDRVEATYLLPLHKITIAKWLVDLMKTQYGDSNVSFVPNGVDTQQFYAPPRGKNHHPTVGLMYSQLPWKGSDISIKAFSLAAQKIPDLRLVALGGIPPLPEIPLPPGTEYAYKPAQNALKDFYSKCDAWLFGSRVEGFGLPIVEAMACRTPVIGTPTGAAPELLTNGAGILVKPEDPEDMAKAIEQICRLSDAEWRVMSEAAYAKATSYTWDKATDLFEAALHTTVNRCEQGDFLGYKAKT